MRSKSRHLAQFLQNDELAYRTCILYESLRGKPALEAYDKMQSVIPKRDYYTFQYWFFRFLNGNYDLNHDPSLDPETRSFLDMPTNVMEKIVGYLDLVDTLSTGKVCRKLRDVVDNVKKIFDEVDVRFKLNYVVVKTRWQSIAYQSNQIGGVCCTVNRKKCVSLKTLEECDYLEMAVRDIASFMKKQNWGYHKLMIEFEPESEHSQKRKAYAKQFSFVESILSHSSIHAERLVITAWNSDLEPMEKLLPYMKADVLKSIKFKCEAFEPASIEKIMKMEQWKRAKELDLSHIPDWFIIKNLFHAERFSIQQCTFTTERLFWIKDICFKNPNFKGCFLRSDVEQYDRPEPEDPVHLVETVLPEFPVYDYCTQRYCEPHSTQRFFKITTTPVMCGTLLMQEYVELKIERIRNQTN
ncbi:unnamed protein product [Caenorhabditis brenneri]